MIAHAAEYTDSFHLWQNSSMTLMLFCYTYDPSFLLSARFMLYIGDRRLDNPAVLSNMPKSRIRDEIKLWRDPALGEAGVEMLTGHCFEHRYSPHFHEEVVVATFTSGAQRHSIGRRSGVAGPGSILIIPSGETHSGEAAQEAGWSYRAFYPDRTTLAAIASDLFGQGQSASLTFDLVPMHQDQALSRRLAALHEVIMCAVSEPLARQQAFAAAMAAVLVRYAQPMKDPTTARAEPTMIRRAVDLVHARLGDADLSITDMARAAGLSSYHFMRCFRATTGLTAHAFVVQQRVCRARKLLADGLSSAEVALSVGFSDQSHLIRHFRRALGVTPGQYARESRLRQF
jgi:AraC-like DNA-binding protein